MYTTIAMRVSEAEKQNQSGKVIKIQCCLIPERICPFYEEHSCIRDTVFWDYCPYGDYDVIDSPTKRAKSYLAWLNKYKAEREGLIRTRPSLGYIKKRVAIVGDYVYVPTSHADMESNKNVPFLAHSFLFTSGKPFIKIEDFTPEIAVEIANFRPHAMMGGEITSYQAEEIPKYLFELKQALPAIYAKAVALDASLEARTLKIDHFFGKSVLLRDMPKGEIEVVISEANPRKGEPARTCMMQWDGKKLTGKISRHDASTLLGWHAEREQEVEVTFAPDDKLAAKPSDVVVKELFTKGVLKP